MVVRFNRNKLIIISINVSISKNIIPLVMSSRMPFFMDKESTFSSTAYASFIWSIPIAKAMSKAKNRIVSNTLILGCVADPGHTPH